MFRIFKQTFKMQTFFENKTQIECDETFLFLEDQSNFNEKINFIQFERFIFVLINFEMLETT